MNKKDIILMEVGISIIGGLIIKNPDDEKLGEALTDIHNFLSERGYSVDSNGKIYKDDDEEESEERTPEDAYYDHCSANHLDISNRNRG